MEAIVPHLDITRDCASCVPVNLGKVSAGKLLKAAQSLSSAVICSGLAIALKSWSIWVL